MNLKAIMGVLIYYVIVSSLFIFGSSYLGGASTTAPTPPDLSYYENQTNPSYVEGSSSFFSKIGSALNLIGGTLGFAFFGIGLPSDTPGFIQTIFTLMFVVIDVINLTIVINAFWGGGGD